MNLVLDDVQELLRGKNILAAGGKHNNELCTQMTRVMNHYEP